jgi:m7GpppX diphosphatase
VEKTPYEPGEAVSLASAEAWSRLEMVRRDFMDRRRFTLTRFPEQKTCNDIYSTSLAWFAPGRSKADVQLTSICPATEKVS